MKYCSNCGNKLDKNVNFCVDCGQQTTNNTRSQYEQMIPSTEITNDTRIDYDSFLHLPEYYKEEFTKIISSNKIYTGKFNWAAFLFGPLWAISKGLWLPAIIAFVGAIITGGIVGFRGNYMYFNKVVNGEQTIF